MHMHWVSEKLGYLNAQNEKIGLLSFENMGFIIGLYLHGGATSMPNSMHVHRDGLVGCFRGCCMGCAWGEGLYTVSWKELIVVFVLQSSTGSIGLSVYSSMLIFWIIQYLFS